MGAAGGGLDGVHGPNPSSEGDGSNGKHIVMGALRGRFGAGSFLGAVSTWPIRRGAKHGGVECILQVLCWLNYDPQERFFVWAQGCD